MSTLRDSATETDLPLASKGALRAAVKEMQAESTRIDCDMQRLAVRLHYLAQKTAIVLDNLERHTHD